MKQILMIERHELKEMKRGGSLSCSLNGEIVEIMLEIRRKQRSDNGKPRKYKKRKPKIKTKEKIITKPVECEFCGARYKTGAGLSTHIRFLHPSKKKGSTK